MINIDTNIQELYDVHVEKKKQMCARAQFIPDECLLDIGLIVQSQRDELSNRMAKFKNTYKILNMRTNIVFYMMTRSFCSKTKSTYQLHSEKEF